MIESAVEQVGLATAVQTGGAIKLKPVKQRETTLVVSLDTLLSVMAKRAQPNPRAGAGSLDAGPQRVDVCVVAANEQRAIDHRR